MAATALAPNASATPPSATYTISVGSPVSSSPYDDSPASMYTDKDGTFYTQLSHSLYGASQGRAWDFFTGSNFGSVHTAGISSAVNPANPQDRNDDTTWRCNNSVTGVNSTYTTDTGSYSQRNFCDLIGTWVDPDTGDWYGLVHNEFTPEPFGAYSFSHYDAIDYTKSTDQGHTWSIVGHAITSPYSTTRGDSTAFPNQTFDYGDGDPRLFVDYASGYFYVFYGSRIVGKADAGGGFDGLAHVARAPISSKMATGSWSKWYNGSWSQPGVGGLESNQVPVTASNPNGYTPVSGDYDPNHTGTVDQQVAAGTLPPKSDLFVMNIAYDAYLGLYIGAPEAVAQSGTESQRYYVTDDLSTQKWHLIGDTGSYTEASWYRWFLDPANLTSSAFIGKTFRAYCGFGCHTYGSEYTTQTITSSAPAAAPFDPAKTYTIAGGNGRLLAQASGSSATTSDASPTGSSLEAWQFTANGDGSYRITDAGTGQALGVDSGSNAGRAWAAKPTVTALSGSTGTVGQQWFIVKNTSPSGTYRLVNRYSGLVLGLSSDPTRLAETTPVRFWTNTTGDPVGGTRTGTEQTLTVNQIGTGTTNLNGTHTMVASGKALDDPGHSTTPGSQLITWTPNAGANQNWVFTRQSDGSYQIVNAESGLCVDDGDWSTNPGAKVIQWTCTGAANQHWNPAKLANGAYTLTNAHSGLLLTTASTADLSPVTQQTNTNSALQQWNIN
ncbi:RICIN domain-containing protein [Catenulispora rubra]|uniref:RICIN domain-containing protein n=1 Tax=Catenulispora rubra TaxID=280293 RepID=UPI0018927165|nr:RICIN domain-containing protein [Catenulispora rubra]